MEVTHSKIFYPTKVRLGLGQLRLKTGLKSVLRLSLNLRLYAVKKNFRRYVSLNFRLYAVEKKFQEVCIIEFQALCSKKKFQEVRSMMRNDGPQIRSIRSIRYQKNQFQITFQQFDEKRRKTTEMMEVTCSKIFYPTKVSLGLGQLRLKTGLKSVWRL